MSRANVIKDILKGKIPTMSSEEINSISHNLVIEEEKHKKKFKKTFRNDELVRKARNRHTNTTKKIANAKSLQKERNLALIDKKEMELEEMYGKLIDAGIISMPGVPKKMNGTYKKNSTYYISRRSIYPKELASEEMRRLIKKYPAAYEYAINTYAGSAANSLHDKAKKGEIGIDRNEIHLPPGTDRSRALNFLEKEESGSEGGGAGAPVPTKAPAKALVKAPVTNYANNTAEVVNIMIKKPAAPAPAPAPAPASIPNLVPTNWANNDEFSLPVVVTKGKGGGSAPSNSLEPNAFGGKRRKTRRHTRK